MLLELHLAILNRLRPLQTITPGLQLRLMPNSPNAHLRAVQDSQAVLFMPESKFDPPDVQQSQPWRICMALELRLPTNWNDAGMALTIEAAARLLVGFRPPQGDRIVLDHTILDGEYEDFWVHRIIFWVPCRIVAEEPEQSELTVGVLIRRIQAINAMGATTADVQIPGPPVTAPEILEAVRSNVDNSLRVTWTEPDPVPGQTLVGYVLQVFDGQGQWTHSEVIPPTLSEYLYHGPAIAADEVRLLVMWTLENSDWIMADVVAE